MTKAADPNLEPFIDNLWYFDSVVSTKHTPAPAIDGKSAADNDQYILASFSENQLPLSTGGESPPRAPYSSCYTDELSHSEAPLCGDGGICASCKSSGSRRNPSMCEFVEKIEEEGELTPKELSLWMQKLGLEYTEHGAMIRRVPDADFGSQQKLDFSEFVCLNRFIEEEHRSPQHAHMRFSDAHMASLHEVFDLFDKDDSGLISPCDLCAALTKLGLRSPS